MNMSCVLLLGGAVLFGSVLMAGQAPEDEGEKKVTIDQVPAEVKKTILAEGGEIEDIARQTSKGKVIFEADVIHDGQEIELRVDPDGKLVSRKIEGTVQPAAKATEEESEAQAEARGCVRGGKVVAQAKVTMAEALKTAMKEGKGAKPFKADLELDEGKLLFDIELLEGDKGPEMEIDATTGAVIKIESVEEQEKEDANEAKEGKEGDKDSKDDAKEEERENRAKASAAKAWPMTKVSLAEAVEIAVEHTHGGKAYSALMKPEQGKPRYEIQIVVGDECKEVVVDGIDRKIIEVEAKGTTKATADSDWRSDFKVDKANFVSTGSSKYFILKPGHRTIHEAGNEKLTITILPDTKMIDGVETRVLEEREEKNGRLVEISRNYFALDKTTGDVYYFGEDVDIYKDGKVVDHEGGWLSGEKGAKFGLMVPGKPRRGDRYYQEYAPKIAMDRVEVVSVDEKLETPAGTFEHCLHLRETTPLESDVSHKIYAPDIGLIKDDDLTLIKVEKP